MSSRTNMIKMGMHIADLRKKKNLTQKTLGDILDVSDKTVSKWEQGVAAPDITLLQSLSNVLEVSVEEIITGKEINNINTIEAIDMYSSMTKNKLIKTFIVFIFLFAILIFFIFRIEDYYSWHLDSIYSRGDISFKGFVLMNNKESKLVINKMFLTKESMNYKMHSIEVIIKNNEEIIYKEKSSFDELTSLESFFNNYVISIENNGKLKRKNILIYFIIEEENGLMKTYTYDFK